MFGKKDYELEYNKNRILEDIDSHFNWMKKETKRRIDKNYKKEIIDILKNCNSHVILNKLRFSSFSFEALYQFDEEGKQLQLQFLRRITQNKKYIDRNRDFLLFDILKVNSNLSEFCKKHGYELTKKLIDELFDTEIYSKRSCIAAIFNEEFIENDKLKRKIIDNVLELDNGYKLNNISKLLEKEQYYDIFNKIDGKIINNNIDNIVNAKHEYNDKAIGEILDTISYGNTRTKIVTRLIKEASILEDKKQIDFLTNLTPSLNKSKNVAAMHQSINMVYNIENPMLFDKIEKFISKTVLHIENKKIQDYLFDKLRTIKNGKSLELLSDIIPILMKYNNQNDTIITIGETIWNEEFSKNPKQFQIVYK